jgi:hypothetical protein
VLPTCRSISTGANSTAGSFRTGCDIWIKCCKDIDALAESARPGREMRLGRRSTHDAPKLVKALSDWLLLRVLLSTTRTCRRVWQARQLTELSGSSAANSSETHFWLKTSCGGSASAGPYHASCERCSSVGQVTGVSTIRDVATSDYKIYLE